MVSLFLILFLVATVIYAIRRRKSKPLELFDFPIIGIILFSFDVCLVLAFCYLIDDFTNLYIIDDKIAMYQEENATIEENIDGIVRNYMNFEATTYEKFKDEDSMNLISLFPELKSDILVSQQIEIYVANNQKIKELKEEKINLTKTKWLLYFGS